MRRYRRCAFMALDAYPASAALSPASIFSAASSCIPGITWLAPAAAIILQPKRAVRDCLRWDAMGIRPQILAANGYTSCDCAGVAGFLWAHAGRPSERPLTAVTRVRIPYALPLIYREITPLPSPLRRLKWRTATPTPDGDHVPHARRRATELTEPTDLGPVMPRRHGYRLRLGLTELPFEDTAVSVKLRPSVA